MPEALADPDLPHAVVLGELARVSASTQLRRARLLQRLLSHIVRAALAGNTASLRETTLALECLRRDPSRFDPHTDPGVRVAVTRLRRKLAEYYDTSGAGAHVRITLPVGSYVPTFIRQRSTPLYAGSAAAERGSEIDPAARDAYDRGRFALRQQNAAGYRKAIELLQRATGIAPAFADGWSSLALARLGLVGMTTVPSREIIDAAREAVMRTLAIDPAHSEAHASLASIVFRYDLDFTRAEPLYRDAIRLDPSSRYAHHAYAFALTMNGRFDEADAEYRIAREIDPLDQTLRCQHALMPIYTGRYDTAESALLAILDLDAGNILARSLLGATYLYANKPSRALTEYQRIIASAPSLSIGWCGRGQALAMLGLRKKARAVLLRMVAEDTGNFVSPYQVAMVHARLDDEPSALEWLARAAAQRDANFICAPVDPAFDGLRRTPQWTALMHEHGLGQAAALRTRQPRRSRARAGSGRRYDT